MFTTSTAGRNLIAKCESCKLTAYLCPAKIPTIGYGNTTYEDGTPVQLGDKISQERAEQLFTHVLKTFETGVNTLIKSSINQNQFDALVSFVYNVGLGNFKSSTLLKKVNAEPNDPAIKNEFMKWNKGGGKILKGLTNRRTAEADLYFS